MGWFWALSITIACGWPVVLAISNERASSRAHARRRLRAGGARPADGSVVTLTGTVRAIGPLLEAPLSGRGGVLYRSAGRLPRTEPVVEAQMVAFELHTAEGIVRVDGAWAELLLPPVPLAPRQLERERSFLVRGGLEIMDDADLATANFAELVLEPGHKISVHGLARIVLDPASSTERGYRDDGPRRITIIEPPAAPITIARVP